MYTLLFNIQIFVYIYFAPFSVPILHTFNIYVCFMKTWESIQSIIDEQDAQIEKLNTNVDLLISQVQNTKMEGLCHHFGQGMNGQADYTESQMQPVIDKALRMRLNYFRGDFNTDDNGKPSVIGDKFLNMAQAASLSHLAILYLKDRAKLPADGKSYTQAELDNTYQKNFNACKAFATAYPFINYYQADNELDVFALGSTGKGYINYDVSRYGLSIKDEAFYTFTMPLLMSSLQGFKDGIKAANTKNKFGINYAWRHTGLGQRIHAVVPLDWIGVDAYNSEEYGIDEKGLSTYGRFVELTKADFSDVKDIIVTEMGFKPFVSNPNRLTQSQHLLPLFQKYVNQCKGAFLYEALNETITRAKSNDKNEAVLGITEETVLAFQKR